MSDIDTSLQDRVNLAYIDGATKRTALADLSARALRDPAARAELRQQEIAAATQARAFGAAWAPERAHETLPEFALLAGIWEPFNDTVRVAVADAENTIRNDYAFEQIDTVISFADARALAGEGAAIDTSEDLRIVRNLAAIRYEDLTATPLTPAAPTVGVAGGLTLDQAVRAPAAEALLVGIPGVGEEPNRLRLQHAQYLSEQWQQRANEAYRDAAGSTVDPTPRQVFGLELLIQHHGNPEAVLASDTFDQRLAEHLGLTAQQEYVNDEDGARYEQTEDLTDTDYGRERIATERAIISAHISDTTVSDESDRQQEPTTSEAGAQLTEPPARTIPAEHASDELYADYVWAQARLQYRQAVLDDDLHTIAALERSSGDEFRPTDAQTAADRAAGTVIPTEQDARAISQWEAHIPHLLEQEETRETPDTVIDSAATEAARVAGMAFPGSAHEAVTASTATAASTAKTGPAVSQSRTTGYGR